MSFQDRAFKWWEECLGSLGEPLSSPQRVHRFIEESLELAQACDIPKEEVLALVEYVYNRPKGLVHQEVGGVLVCLAVLCRARNIIMHHAGEVELARCNTNMEKIRSKQASKKNYASPLPGGAD